MRWIEARVVFEAKLPALAEEIIGAAFSDSGLQSVAIEDPDAEPKEGWETGAPKRARMHAVSGYFPETPDTDGRCRLLESMLTQRLPSNICRYRIMYETVDEEDWAESWKEFFWPERVGEHIVVKPTWRQFDPRDDDLLIDIDPGMAFGTGTHPTTALSIRLLEKMVQPGNHVLDVGTGSGILLIAAAKLGASGGLAIDNDPVAVQVAHENLTRNGLAENRFGVLSGDLATAVQESYDLVTANILTDVIMRLIDQLPAVMRPGAAFICSGIIEAYTDRVRHCLQASGFQVLEIQKQSEWIAIAARLAPNSGRSQRTAA